MFKIITRLHFILFIILALFILATGCKKNDFVPVIQPDANKYSAHVAVDWMELTRQLIRLEAKNPPQASRIYAYAGIAVYESSLPGINGYQSLQYQIQGLSQLPNSDDFGPLDFTVSVNEAMYNVLLKIFDNVPPENLRAIEDLHNKYISKVIRVIPTDILNNSTDFGKMVASAVLKRADTDNFFESRSMNYTVPDWNGNAGYWAPTDNNNLKPLEPFWGTVKCFAMTSADECEILASIPFSSVQGSAFYNQSLEVFNVSNSLTNEEKDIAKWWADGAGTATPPGHWVAIENELVSSLNLGLGKAAEMYALVNIGMADAFISCWDAKYKYNLLRPQTYIQNYITGQANWKPYIGTPPFPEYPSGHSVASGVAAAILTRLFGDVAFTDKTNESQGLAARTYNSFKDAADEAAISRLYGGIHYREACENGLAQGELVANSVMKNLRLKR